MATPLSPPNTLATASGVVASFWRSAVSFDSVSLPSAPGVMPSAARLSGWPAASPLTRARDTAAPIALRLGLTPRYEADLREYHLGEWEGVTYADLAREHRLFERMQADPDWQPGGGESARQVAERLAGRLGAISAAHAGERVIVVTHGGALTLGLGWLLDRDVSTWRRVMHNGAVSDLVFDPEPSLLCFDEVAHLEGLA